MLDASLMSFNPSANQFNSLHYPGWIGIYIMFPHTCLLWHKGNESFLCHSNKAGLYFIHQRLKLWFLLHRKSSQHKTASKTWCSEKANLKGSYTGSILDHVDNELDLLRLLPCCHCSDFGRCLDRDLTRTQANLLSDPCSKLVNYISCFYFSGDVHRHMTDGKSRHMV